MQIPNRWARLLRRVQRARPGAMIFGGALRDRLLNRPIKDLDVCYPTDFDTDAEVETVRLGRALGGVGLFVAFRERAPERPWRYTLASPAGGLLPDRRVELAGVAGCRTPAQMVGRSSLNICQIATDGHRLYATEAFREGLRTRRIWTMNEYFSPAHIRRVARKYPDFSVVPNA